MRSIAATTDGFRGPAGTDFTEPALLAYLHAALQEGALPGPLLIGHDARAGARDFAHLAADLLTHWGRVCLLADTACPTPALGRFIHADPWLGSGVILTASHNPPGHLGVKLRDRFGGPTTVAVEGTEILEQPLPPYGGYSSAAVAARYADTVGRDLAAAVDTFAGQVIVDCAHGAVGSIAALLPAAVTWSRGRPLPFFAGTIPDPTRQPDTEKRANAVVAASRDPNRALVASTDGDGDRLVLFTRASGSIGSAEQAALLLSAGLPAEQLIVTTVTAHATRAAAQDRHVAVQIVPVGFKHIAAVRNGRATLGVEPNGALAWAPTGNHWFDRDALATLALILNTFGSVSGLDDAVAAHRARYPYPQHTLSTPTPVDRVVDGLSALLTGWNTAVITGGTVEFSDGGTGRIVVRASGTEPCTRLYVEAEPQLVSGVCDALNLPQ